MIDFSNILTRASSRLFVAFIVTIWACVTYVELSWIFVTAFGVYTLGYMIVKIFGYRYNVEDDTDYYYDERSELVDELGRFKQSEIGPLNKDV